jgi:hypothetical protein
MPPRSQRTLSVRRDDYAPWRCPCGHLRYRDQKPGDPCVAAVVYPEPRCDCTDQHIPAKAGGGDQ